VLAVELPVFTFALISLRYFKYAFWLGRVANLIFTLWLSAVLIWLEFFRRWRIEISGGASSKHKGSCKKVLPFHEAVGSEGKFAAAFLRACMYRFSTWTGYLAGGSSSEPTVRANRQGCQCSPQ
jgi:hypothetical protein